MQLDLRRLLLFLVPLLLTPRYSYSESILQAPTTGLYLGTFASYPDGDATTLGNSIADFKTNAGKSVVWAIVLSEWGQALEFPKAQALAAHNQGAIPFLRILPRSIPDETYTLDPVLRLDLILKGDFDAQIRQWADGARDVGFPILAEFGPEPNGFWNQWSGIFYQNGPALYAAVFQRIVTICRAEGASNITWFFHMNGEDNPHNPDNLMTQYYPGDAYIDWIGVSVLGAQINADFWDEFVDVMDSAYNEIIAVSAVRPVALVETAVIEDPKDDNHKAKWITDSYHFLKANRWPRLKAYSYWNEISGTAPEVDDMRINSSPQARSAFRAAASDSFFISAPLWGRASPAQKAGNKLRNFNLR